MDKKNRESSGYRLRSFSGNVIFFAGFGEWVLSDIDRFCREVNTLAESFEGSDWCLLGDVTGWTLEQQDVQNAFRACVQTMKGTGCSSVVFYSGPGALKRLSFYRLMDPDSPGFCFRVFLTRQRAVRALRIQDFAISEDDIKSFFREEGSSR